MSLLLAGLPWVAGAQTPPAEATQVVEVIGTSPLPGQGVSRDLLPYATQLVRRSALETAQADNVSDHLARRLPGVQVNDIQGSPFQGDLSFRGYRASGILGASQGLSVYLDGVRVNEPFGDVVNWDMVPEFSVDSLSLVPGANPAFGLNSLGGALAFTTATGLSAPGWRAEASLGSFGRKRLDVALGVDHGNGWHHYLAAGGFDENGWRDHSAGHLGHVLAKLGHNDGTDSLSLNLLAGSSTLVGNGLVPLYSLGEDGERSPDLGQLRRSAVYTHPDQTENQLAQLGGQWRRQLDNQGSLEALVYLRQSRRETINGDEADGDDDDVATQVRIAKMLPHADDTDTANASFNRTATRQSSWGLALARSGRHAGHQWQLGASVDAATVRYEQTEQAGVFDDSRGVLPVADEEAELSARVEGSSRSLGLYATDTWSLSPSTHLTTTVRWNQARVSNQLDTVDDDSGELEVQPRETFTYRSLNPAVGLAHRLDNSSVTLFANVARNNRVPTVIELGCADPEEPCRLPAGLQADPYLKQVVSVTTEAGLRFGRSGAMRGTLTLFNTDNRDDIVFRSVSVAGQLGYFQNFARTRHRGLEAELQDRLGALDWSVNYSHLDATYQADGVLRMGERNVLIVPGTRIAGLPRHMLKLAADWALAPGWSLGADVQALSARGVAGNEDGLIENGEDETHDLSLPGYGLLNLRAAWRPATVRGLELFGRISNVFDRRYASFGALAATQFDPQGAYVGEETDVVSVAPGAPRAFTVGARWRF